MTDRPDHGSDNLAVARLDVPRTRFDHAGWPIDAYPELPMLDAHTTMVVADIEGPGVITNIHVSRFLDPPKSFERDDNLTVDQQRAIGARGVVIEITFDDSDRPSVCVPLADFFADGACGSAALFSSLLVEKAPGSYNARIPMPFAGSARVALRNDTDLDLLGYVAVESRRITWEPTLGYLHATWQRDAFPLDTNTSFPMLSLTGPGKLIGQAWTVATDEPFFDGFAFVMEGNNQFDIDGTRSIDYLGTEDAFGFAWGFQGTFTGPHSGITSVSHGEPSIVAMYRFRSHDPIAFDKSLDLTVDWTHEFNSELFHRRVAPLVPTRTWLPPDRSEGGGWIDYARTTYWYAASPGHDHTPMSSLNDRVAPVLHPNPVR